MTYKQIYTMINSIGLSCAYYAFPEGSGTNPPFIIFYYPYSDDFVADNSNFQTITQLNVELYTDAKDFTKEASVEAVLTAAGLVFRKEEQWLETERMFEVLYTMEVIINGEQS